MIKENFLYKTVKIMNLHQKLILRTDLEDKTILKSRFNDGFTVSPNEITINTIPEDDIDFGTIDLQVYKTETESDYTELVTEFLKDSSLIVETFLYSFNSKELTVTSGWDDYPLPENTIPLTNNTTQISLLKGENKILIILYSFDIFVEKESKNDDEHNQSIIKDLFKFLKRK